MQWVQTTKYGTVNLAQTFSEVCSLSINLKYIYSKSLLALRDSSIIMVDVYVCITLMCLYMYTHVRTQVSEFTDKSFHPGNLDHRLQTGKNIREGKIHTHSDFQQPFMRTSKKHAKKNMDSTLSALNLKNLNYQTVFSTSEEVNNRFMNDSQIAKSTSVY